MTLKAYKPIPRGTGGLQGRVGEIHWLSGWSGGPVWPWTISPVYNLGRALPRPQAHSVVDVVGGEGTPTCVCSSPPVDILQSSACTCLMLHLEHVCWLEHLLVNILPESLPIQLPNKRVSSYQYVFCEVSMYRWPNNTIQKKTLSFTSLDTTGN